MTKQRPTLSLDDNQGLLAIWILLLECFRSAPVPNENESQRIAREQSDLKKVDRALSELSGAKLISHKNEDLMIEIASKAPEEGVRARVSLTSAVRNSLIAASRNRKSYDRQLENENSTVKRRMIDFRAFKAALAKRHPLDAELFTSVMKIAQAFKGHRHARPRRPLKKAKRKVSKE